MEYNFADFLKESRKQCKTREDFMVKISREMELVNDGSANPQFFIDKPSYLKRLEGAKFAAIANQFKEPDKYNEELMKLLGCLL